MPEFRTTKDYSIFKYTKYNRDVKENNVARVERSLTQSDKLSFVPIIVDKHMRIIDGQNRLEAAKQLGLEVTYVTDENAKPSDILLFNLHQNPWKLEDFMKHYISAGNEDYIRFEEFIEEQEISLRNGLRLMLWRAANPCRDFRLGNFKFPSDEEMKRVVKILDNYRETIYLIKTKKFKGQEITSVGRFCDSLMQILMLKDTDFKTFLSKLQYRLESLHLCGTQAEYYDMLKKIYNWKNQKPLADK